MDSVLNKLKILITDKDQWVNGEGEFEGDPFFMRYRPHLSNFIKAKLFPYRLVVYWPFKGLEPNKKEYKAMIKFEDLLVANLEEDGLKGVLAFVYTPKTSKEWQVYVQKRNEAKNVLDAILENFQQYQIEYVFRKDPNWEHYKQVLEESSED
jgi:hypothetical protein